MYKTVIFLSFLSFTLLLTASESIETAYCNLAKAFAHENNIEESVFYYNKALERNENHLLALLGLGKTLIDKKQNHEEAIPLLQKRLELDSNHAETHSLLAHALVHMKQIDKALEHYKYAVSLEPKNINIYTKFIDILLETNHKDKAILTCKKAIKHNPTQSSFKKKLIDLLTQQKQYKDAITACDDLINLDPNKDNYKMKKAHLLTLNHQYNKALDIFYTLLEKHNNHPNILFNIAQIQKIMGAFDDAIETYKQVEAIAPHNQQIHLGLGQSYLALGNFKDGWETIDHYYKKQEVETTLTNLKQIPGQTILIQGEWDLSDMIQLMRYAREIKKLGAHEVIVQTPHQLEPLLNHCPYIDKTITINTKQACTFHKQIPIMRLPKLFETEIDTIPVEIPYIHPPQDLLKFWGNKLKDDKKRIKIGLYITKDADIPLELIIKIAEITGISIYMLHEPDNTSFLSSLSFQNIIHTCGKGFSFSQDGILHLTALIKHLDLVISSDNLAAHLAGAVGTPVWLILKDISDWRWMQNINYCPWYPTMQIFRKSTSERWELIIDTIKKQLKNIV